MDFQLEEAKSFLKANNYDLKLLEDAMPDGFDDIVLQKLNKFCKNNMKNKTLQKSEALMKDAKHLIKNGLKTIEDLKNDGKYTELTNEEWLQLWRFGYNEGLKDKKKMVLNSPKKMAADDTSIGTHNRGTGLE